MVSKPDVTSTVTFADDTNPKSGITVNHYGEYTLRWTETNGNCSLSDDVTFTFYEAPTANAGSNDEVSATLNYTLDATPFSYAALPNENSGTYTWSLESSSTGGTVTNWGTGADTPTPTITVDLYGDYVFRWTETNGTCSDFAEVTIRFVEGANAGPDQDLCDVLATTLAGNTPSTGQGTWTQISGSGTVVFDDENDPTTDISADAYDEYVLQWTFDVGSAPENEDQVTIDFNELPIATAPADYNVCEDLTINLSGTIGGGASTGTWSVIANGSGSMGGSTTAAGTVTATYTLDASDPGQTITFRLTTDDPAGACAAQFDDVNVWIEPTPATEDITGTTDICGADADDNYYYALDDGSYIVSGNEYVWTVPAGATLKSGGQLGDNFIVLAFPSTGTFILEVQENTTSPIVCYGEVKTLEINVSEVPVAHAGDDQTICQSDTVILGGTTGGTDPSATGGSGDYSYEWLPNLSLDDNTLEHPEATPMDTLTYQLIVTDNVSGCESDASTVDISVNPKPAIYSAPSSQIICDGDPTSFTVNATGDSYEWQYSTDGGTTWDPVPDDATYDDVTTTTLIVNAVTLGMDDNRYRMVAHGTAPCPSVTSAEATLSVLELPSISAQPDPDEICEGENTSFEITASGSSISYQWYVSTDGGFSFDPLSDGGNNFGATTNKLNIFDTPASYDGNIYKVRVTNSCTSVESNEVALTVNSNVAITVQPTDITQCDGTTAKFSVTVTGTGPLTYQWRRNGTNLDDADTDISGATTADLQIDNLETADEGNYDVVITGLCSSTTSDAAVLALYDNVTIDTEPADVNECAGTTASFTVAASGEGPLTYQWYNTGGALSDAGDISGVTTATLQIANIEVADEDDYYVEVGGLCTGATSANATLTIDEDVTIDTGPVAVTECEGSEITFTVAASGTITSYQWRKGTTDLSDADTDISGATTATLTIDNIETADEGNYNVVITGPCNSVTSADAALNVDDLPVITAQPGDVTQCEGTQALFAITATGTAPLTYQWSNSGGDLDELDGDITGSTTASLTIDNIETADEDTYEVTVTNLCGTATSDAVTLAVDDNITITADPAPVTQCEGTTATFSVTATGTGINSYQWRKDGNPIADGGDVSGTQTAVLTINNIETADEGLYSVTVAGTCDPATSADAELAVDDNIVITSQPANETICEGLTATFNVVHTGTGPVTYQWRKNGFALTDGGDISGATTDELQITNAQTAYEGNYDVIITGHCSTLGSNTASLSVDDDVEIIVQPVNFADCEGETANFSVLASGTDLTYQWRKDGADLSNGGDINGVNSTNLTIANIENADEGTYDVVVSGACVGATSNGVTLDVYDNAVINTQPDPVTQCQGTTATFTVEAEGTGLSYQWRRNGTPLSNGGSISGAQSSTLTILNIQTANEGNYDVVITGTCSNVTSDLVSLNVNDNVVITGQPTNETECEGETGFFNVTATGTGLTYQWRRNGVDLVEGGDITGSQSPNLSIANLEVADEGTYDVVITGDCSVATSNGAVLDVQEDVTITSQPVDVTRCEGNPATFTVVAEGTGPLTYQWYKDASPLGNGGDISGATSSSLTVANIEPADAGTYTVQVTGTCSNTTSAGALLTVQTNAVITGQPAGDLLCQGDQASFTVTATGTGLTYQWRKDGVNLSDAGDIAGATTANLTIDNLEPGDEANYDVVITGTCSNVTSDDAFLDVQDAIVITGQPDPYTGCDGTTATFTVTATGPGLTYQWRKDGVDLSDGGDISGATSATLQIANIESTDEGDYDVVITGTCETVTSNAVALTMLENVVITAEPVASQTLCEDLTANFTVTATGEGLTYQWRKNSGNLTDGGRISGATTASLAITDLTEADAGSYDVVVTGTCTAETSAASELNINVKPQITQQPADDAICENSGTSFTINTGSTTAPSIAWQYDDGGWNTITTDEGGIFADWTTTTLTLSNVGTGWDGTPFRAIVSNLCGDDATSDVATLTVDGPPVILTEPVSVTSCEGTNVSFSLTTDNLNSPTYAWFENDGTSGWQPVVNGGIYTGANSTTLQLTGIDSAMTGYLYRAEVTNFCGGPVATTDATLTVENPARIWTQPAEASTCEGTATSFTVAATGTTLTYQWKVDMRDGSGYRNIAIDSAGVYTGHDQATLQLLDPTSRFDGYRYRVVVTSTECGSAVTSDYAELTVNEVAEILTPPEAKIICEEQGTTFSVNAGVTTNPTYTWEVDENSGTFVTIDGTTDPAVYSGENSSVLILSGVPSAYNGYRYRVTVGSSSCPDTETSPDVTLTVNELPEIVADPVNDTVCATDPASFTVDPGLTTDPGYQWQVNKSGAWVNLTAADETSGEYTGVTAQTLTVQAPTIAFNNYRYRAIVSGECAPSVTSEAATLTIDTRPVITEDPATQTICEDDNVEFYVNAGTTTEPEYLWEYSTDGGGSWSGASALPEVAADDEATLTVAAVPSAYTGYWFRATVSGKCTDPVPSGTAVLTVNEKPEVIGQPGDTTACEQDTVWFVVDAGVTTNPGYTWQYFNGVSWLNLSNNSTYAGVNSDTLVVSAISSSLNGVKYRVRIAGTCAPEVLSDEATLTVNERPEVVGAPQSMTTCEGDDAWFGIGTGVTTAPVVTWEVSTDGGGVWTAATGGIFSTNAAGDTLMLTAAGATYNGAQFRATVSNLCGPDATSMVATLTHYVAPEIVVQPADSTVCEMQNVSFSVDVGATYAPAIQWYEDDGSGMTALSDGGSYIGTTTNTLQVFGVDSAMTGYRYEARVTNLCGGPLASDAAVLTVHAAPVIWTQPVDATICEGENTSFSVVATGEALTYEWFVDDGQGGGPVPIVNDGVYGGQGTPTLTLTAPDRNYHLHRYYVTIDGSCQPRVQSNIAFLRVENPPEVTVAPVNDTICEFNTAEFSVNATGAGLTYQWYESEDGTIYNALSDGGNYIGTKSSNLNIFSVDRGYDGTMYRVIVGGTCAPDAEPPAVDLTVNTTPVITAQPADTTVCDNSFAAFTVEAVGSELTYQWRVNKKTGVFVDIASDDTDYEGAQTDSLTKVNALFAENGYTYRAVVSGYCSPPAQSNPVLMNVNTPPGITAEPADRAVCEGGALQFSASAVGPDLMYQWMVNEGAGWDPVVDDGVVYSGANSDQLTLLTTSVSMDGNLYRLDVSSSCEPVSSVPVVLTVWENPEANITGDLANFPKLCGGETLLLDGGPEGGSGVYTTHKWSGDILFLDGVTAQTAEFMTNVKGDYNINYSVTDNNGCVGQASVVLQNFKPRAQFESDAVPACGDLLVQFTNQSSADVVDFAWDFDNGAFSSEENPSAFFDNFDPSGVVAYYNVTLTATDAEGCEDVSQTIITVYPKVDPTITAEPLSGCQPLEVSFRTQSGAAGYFWNFGDGTQENGRFTATHFYSNLTSSVQTYEAILRTTSAYGCEAFDTVEIVVDPIPQPQFTASPGMMTWPGAGNAVVTFNNMTEEGPWTFVYDFGDGSELFTTTSYDNVVHEFTEPGIYNVKLYTNVGPCLDSAMQVVTINPRRPEAAFTSITEGCHPLEVNFTNNSQWADSYLWQFGDGSISREENPTHVFYQPGEFTVRLVASGGGGNSDPASQVIDVFATPQVFFNYAPDSVFVNDKPVRFFNLSNYAVEYLWDFGDVSEFDDEVDPKNTSTEADPTHIYMYEGWKDVKLIGRNESCVDSLLIPMAVKVIPAGELQFPNIFRPGDSPMSGVNPNELTDDQRNTIFFPGVNKQVQEYHLFIYNRWGNLIFRSDDINVGWDGFINGQKAAQGVYIWKVTGIYSNGSPFTDAGDVTLVWQ
ncbi:MAG: immunoglobulin domain-containing protein [Bacteroidales bacterium]